MNEAKITVESYVDMETLEKIRNLGPSVLSSLFWNNDAVIDDDVAHINITMCSRETFDTVWEIMEKGKNNETRNAAA